MKYSSEFDTPTDQINTLIKSAVPTPNYQATLQNLTPLDAQRDQVVNHLGCDYSSKTGSMIQTKEQTDTVNHAGRMVKEAQGLNSTIKTNLEKEKKELGNAKKDLQLELSKQKIAFDLFRVLGATIVVYMVFRSFSFVHVLAAVVLVFGILYVLGYNAYSIRLSGSDNSSALPFGSNNWWSSIPEVPRGAIPATNDWWQSMNTSTLPSLDLGATSGVDISKWRSMTPGQ